MSAPAVAVSHDGKRFAAAWKDVREGAPRVWWALASEPRFDRDDPIADEAGVQRNHPSLACDERGTFWAAWEERQGDVWRIRARSSDPRAAVRDVARSSPDVSAFPVVACGAGRVVVAWEEGPKNGAGRVLLQVVTPPGR